MWAVRAVAWKRCVGAGGGWGGEGGGGGEDGGAVRTGGCAGPAIKHYSLSFGGASLFLGGKEDMWAACGCWGRWGR